MMFTEETIYDFLLEAIKTETPNPSTRIHVEVEQGDGEILLFSDIRKGIFKKLDEVLSSFEQAPLEKVTFHHDASVLIFTIV